MTLFGRNQGFFEIMLQKTRNVHQKLNLRQNSVNQVQTSWLLLSRAGQIISTLDQVTGSTEHSTILQAFDWFHPCMELAHLLCVLCPEKVCQKVLNFANNFKRQNSVCLYWRVFAIWKVVFGIGIRFILYF